MTRTRGTMKRKIGPDHRQSGWLRRLALRVAAAMAVLTVILAPTPALAWPLRDTPTGSANLSAPVRSAAPASAQAATGQVTAHDGRFWLGSQPILLHGICDSPIGGVRESNADYAKMASWNMNVVRMRIQWLNVEGSPPTSNGNGTWTHNWDAGEIQSIKDQIGYATANGLYVIIQNVQTDLYPTWLLSSQYNSHGKNYSDWTSWDTDFWSDALMQQFTGDWMSYLASQFAPLPGIVGYEPIPEADPGALTRNQATTQLLLDVTRQVASRVRAADPPRVIIFTTRDAVAEGLPNADLSGWRTLGNVAFDIHGYFGGRWGRALVMDPTSPDFGEVPTSLLGFTIHDGNPPYLGTTIGQIHWLQMVQTYVGQPGSPGAIPVIIGEFTGRTAEEPNMMTLMGTTTQAYNLLGVSWAAWSYDGSNGVFKPDGTDQPWVPLLAAAAAYTE
jgi:cellulase (glycosyl hydrolase family 5)